MANKNQHNSKKISEVSNVGAGLVAAGAAIAAGYYFYISDNAKKNRKMVASWATNLKDEVLDKAEMLKDKLNKESLLGLIDEVAETYYTAKNIGKADVEMVAKELKENWSKVLGELKDAKKFAGSDGSKKKGKEASSK